MLLKLIFLLLLNVTRGAPNDGFPILNPGGIGGIFKGPDSETIIRGPDGSQISAEQNGGSIVTSEGFASPIVVASEPQLEETGLPLPPNVKPIEIVRQDPHIIETEIVAAPDEEPEQSSDLKGPSGRIITKGSASIVSGPASTTITEPRQIIVAPPKIAPQLLVESLAVVSTAAPLGISSTLSPISEAPLALVDSDQIDLSNALSPPDVVGGGIPHVEYSSSLGVLNVPELAAGDLLHASTVHPPGSTSGPAGYLLPPDALAESSVQTSSTASPNIQKILRVEEGVAANGRIDLGESGPPKPSPQSPYQIPQVLSLALSEFYEKTTSRDGSGVVIDDKLGELGQNEIPLATGQDYLWPPDLSRAKYIRPALEKQGVDPALVTLEQVPLTQVNRFTSGYQPGYGRG